MVRVARNIQDTITTTTTNNNNNNMHTTTTITTTTNNNNNNDNDTNDLVARDVQDVDKRVADLHRDWASDDD